MIIEINKDIDKFQESVVLGLTARQLAYSAASVIVGGTMVLLLYKFIGLTGAAYVAIPCVAPIALGGFYSFNGMNFYEYMGKRIHFMFGNKPLTYVSTEGENAIHELEQDQTQSKTVGLFLSGKAKKTVDIDQKKQSDLSKNKEDFEAMKKKTKKIMVITVIAMIIAAVAGILARKYML